MNRRRVTNGVLWATVSVAAAAPTIVTCAVPLTHASRWVWLIAFTASIVVGLPVGVAALLLLSRRGPS